MKGPLQARSVQVYATKLRPFFPGEKKAHKHKLFSLVNVQMALGQTAGCPRVNRAKKFMCSSRNTGNIDFPLRLTGRLSQDCPDFQKAYVFKVYVPFSYPIYSQCLGPLVPAKQGKVQTKRICGGGVFWKEGKGYQNRAPSLSEPRVFF